MRLVSSDFAKKCLKCKLLKSLTKKQMLFKKKPPKCFGNNDICDRNWYFSNLFVAYNYCMLHGACILLPPFAGEEYSWHSVDMLPDS